MQVSVETTTGLERRMKVVVPSTQVESQVEERLAKAATTARINGFRPGKVPIREIKRRFGVGIRQEVSGEIIQASFTEAIQQEDLNPAGIPRVEDLSDESGKDLEFTMVFDVYPDIKLSEFSNIKVEKTIAVVTEDDVNNMVDVLRKQRTEYDPVKRKCKKDDKVNVDFEGFIDDEAFAGGTAKGTDIIMGSSSMIAGFEDGLKGTKAGEDKDLELRFPDDYHLKDLAGKEVLFKIKVNSVSKPRLPDIDAAFFRQFGIEDGDQDAFRAEIRTNMERELDAVISNRLEMGVMDGLLATNDAEIPRSLVDMEIDRQRNEAVNQFGGSNKIDASLLPADMFKDRAERRVRLSLLADAVRLQEKLEADPERVKSKIEELASSYQDPEQVVSWYYGNDQQLDQVKNAVLQEQMIDRILESASVTEVQSSYDDVIKASHNQDHAHDHQHDRDSDHADSEPPESAKDEETT